MGALQKLKAYFGMVPADDVDEYDVEDGRYRREYRSDAHRGDYLDDDDDYPPYTDRPAGRRRLFGRGNYQDDLPEDEDDYLPERARGRAWAGGDAPTHGALAVEPQHEPLSRLRPVPEAPVPPANSLGRIITLHPTSYAEARKIGEAYREGAPVIMNLTEMDDAGARRLVDFAAGLAFALRGSMDKVTNKVFLISPPNIDVTAEERRRLAEGGYFTRG